MRAPGMWPARGSRSSGAPAKRSRGRASITVPPPAGERRRLVDRRQPLGGPGAGGEGGGSRRRPASIVRGAAAARELPAPGAEPAVEQRRLVAGDAQHPDQARGDHPAGVVVGDHGVVVADPERAHRGGEVLRLGERVAAGRAPGRRRG